MTCAASADASAMVALKIVGVSVGGPIEHERQDGSLSPQICSAILALIHIISSSQSMLEE